MPSHIHPLEGDRDPAPLPFPLRAWSVTRFIGRFRGQARVAVTLAARQLSGEIAYSGADDVVLRIDPRDDLQVLMLLGMYDRQVLGALKRYSQPGSVVIDAGGHIGYFSLHAARRVGQTGEVHTFECDPRVLPRLREHVALNNAEQVHIDEFALSDSAGDLRLSLGGVALSTVHPALQEAAEQVVVPARPLDRHLAERQVDLRRVSVIKVDVEGAEAAAVRGMERTIRESDAVLIVEIDPARAKRAGDPPDEIFELLGTFGRRPLTLLSPRGPRPITIDGLRSGESEGAADLLFVPY